MTEQLRKLIATEAIKRIDYLVVACNYTSRFLKYIDEIKLCVESFDSELLVIYDYIDSRPCSIDIPGSLYIRNNNIKTVAEFFKAVPENTLSAYGGSICFKCSDNFIALCICIMLMDMKHCKKFDFDTFSSIFYEKSGKVVMVAKFDTSD
ncbi:hypothetical protein PV-S19_0193 [Pacmanvirus S19]|nr:hypothetical protein PV-S19_0193 [Pacmanvirus S19]